MARIYIGRSTGIGSFERHVVLKLITPERANDQTAVQMFLDEARLAAALNHQNVAQVFEVGEDAGIHYLAMEYVHGQDLRALLAKAGSQGTRVPLELALTVVAGAAAGLNHAHERRGQDGTPLGIVHRDVSPSNIMVGYDGSVKLLDFGIAKATARSVETQSGIIKGKFAYMAPEQCRGRDVDRRSDVFSLGIILYEITTQHRCFRADSDFDTMHRIVTGDVVRPTRLIQGYPQALEAIVMKALAVDPVQRYQSAGLLLEALESFAVQARMSLSTMSLGRFMRDMFGDQQEPWLTQHGRQSQPLQPRESTVSNTNGTGSEPSRRDAQLQTVLDLPGRAGSIDEGEEHAADSNAKAYPTMPPAYASASTLGPEVGLGRQSSPQLPAVQSGAPGAPMPGHASGPTRTPNAAQSSPRHPAPPAGSLPTPPSGHAAQSGPVAAMGSQPLPAHQVPPGQFSAAPGSGSGPSHASHPGYPAVHPTPQPGIPVVTRHGYASGATSSQSSDISYPRYEPPPGMSLDDDSQLRLQPNRRPLFIGLGIAAIGVIVLIVMSLGGSDDKGEKPIVMEQGSSDTNVVTPKMDPPAQGSAAVAAPVDPKKPDPKVDPTPDKGSAAVVTPPEPETIAIEVKTEPKGADVIIAGRVVGTTPLEITRPRSKDKSMIKVHKAGYVDIETEIDFSDDYTSDLTLKKVEETPPPDTGTPDTTTNTKPDIKKPDTTSTKPTTKPTTTKPTTTSTKKPDTTPKPDVKKPDATPKKPACQQPGQYNPIDPRPVCP